MKRLLHTGCGKKSIVDTTPGFNTGEWEEVRLDIDPDVNPDIVASITDMSAVQTGSMDGVFSSHTIEHLHPYEVETAMAEFNRVLKPDGFLVVTTPDLESACRAVLEGGPLKVVYTTDIGPMTPLDIIYGYRPSTEHFPGMIHKCGFTPQLLAKCLYASGFKGVLGRSRPNVCDVWMMAFKDATLQSHFQEISGQHIPSE